MAGRDATDLASLRILFHGGAVAGLTDGQLLERFVTRTGETGEMAFAALVERHGPMVLNTCQAILRDEHGAQDAFQATFFVLARRARSLWVRDSLGPWLHRVARRAANRALVAMVRRKTAERKAAEMTPDHSESEIDRGDLRRFVHEEIDRLPDRHRIPVVLCDLEGRTYEDAARHLGCPVGTVKSRLARGRERLRERLVRRGVTVPAGLAGAALLAAEASAAVPAPLVDPTVRAALQFATGTTSGMTATSASRMAAEVIRTMSLAKLRVFAAIIVALSAASGLAGLFVLSPPASRDRKRSQDPPRLATPASLRETGFRALVANSEWWLTEVDPAARRISVDTRKLPGGPNAFTFVTPPGQPAEAVAVSATKIAPGGVSLAGLKVEHGASVTIGGKAAELAALRAGMPVTLRLAKGHPVVVGIAAGVENDSPPSGPSTYTLTGVNLERRTITVVDERSGLTLNDLPVAANTRIQLLTHHEALRIQMLNLEGLKAGMHLSLDLIASEDGPPVVKGIAAGL